jgi:hypothetical protein
MVRESYSPQWKLARLNKSHELGFPKQTVVCNLYVERGQPLMQIVAGTNTFPVLDVMPLLWDLQNLSISLMSSKFERRKFTYLNPHSSFFFLSHHLSSLPNPFFYF